MCASHLKIKHFELPSANEMEDMKTKLTEMHTRYPILAVDCCWLSVILQISNFEAILYLGHFFYTPCSSDQLKNSQIFFAPVNQDESKVRTGQS